MATEAAQGVPGGSQEEAAATAPSNGDAVAEGADLGSGVDGDGAVVGDSEVGPQQAAVGAAPARPREGVPSSTVFVGGISWKADEASLMNFFSSFGPVLECKIIVDRGTGKSKGYGFVTFESPEIAATVKKSTDLMFLGKMMNVGDAFRKHDRRGGGPGSGGGGGFPRPHPGYHNATAYYGGQMPYYGYQPYVYPYAYNYPYQQHPGAQGMPGAAGAPSQQAGGQSSPEAARAASPGQPQYAYPAVYARFSPNMQPYEMGQQPSPGAQQMGSPTLSPVSPVFYAPPPHGQLYPGDMAFSLEGRDEHPHGEGSDSA